MYNDFFLFYDQYRDCGWYTCCGDNHCDHHGIGDRSFGGEEQTLPNLNSAACSVSSIHTTYEWAKPAHATCSYEKFMCSDAFQVKEMYCASCGTVAHKYIVRERSSHCFNKSYGLCLENA